MAVIDATMFSEDFVALDIRIRELDPVVDLFVICESNFSFSGKRKRFYLSENLARYSDFLHKIRIVRYELETPNSHPWIQESLQRRFLSNEIRNLLHSPMDLIISSDCDEIPRSSVIRDLIGNEANHLLVLRNFTGYLNVECGVYRRGRVVSAKNFDSIEKMRQDCYVFDNWEQRRLPVPVMRIPQWFTCRGQSFVTPELVFKKPQLTVIEDAGWHFNHLLRGDSMRRKVDFSSHTELVHTVNTQDIDSAFASAQDIYQRQSTRVIEIDQSFPVYIQKNRILFENFIFPLDI
jgi:beta-1,4-mannosyl-glycoprotein beta-1,4-N-acetylglucosaminyltransferase